jgi:phosphate transport system protein
MRERPTRGFDSQLDAVRNRLREMSARAQEAFALSCDAFAAHDADLARRTMALDDAINTMEVECDDECLHILARRQPVASDLRFVASAFKLVTDLERLGDVAINICEHVACLQDAPPLPQRDPIKGLAARVAAQLGAASLAFFDDEPQRADAIIAADGAIDEDYVRIAESLAETMRAEPATIAVALRYRSIAKCVERCGDHATNIAELAIFKVRGDDVRHSGASASVSRPPPRA